MSKVSKEYWGQSFKHPLSPNDEDVEIYKRLMTNGSVLLLGCTQNLIPLSSCQLDLDPWYQGPNVIVGDWRENQDEYDNIIGDGVMNLCRDLCEAVLAMSSKKCASLVVRSFNRRLKEMMVASYFPSKDDFGIKPSCHIDMGSYSFFSWRFR